MTAPLVALADAVVESLNGHTFSPAFTCARGYAPWTSREALAVLHVFVVPKATTTTELTRKSDSEELQVDVAVQQALPGNDNEALAARIAAADPLMALIDQIKRFLARGAFALDGLGIWKMVGLANDPAYDPTHWRELNIFTSVVTMTLKGPRAVA